jgi:phosphoribosylanthranilate isomerase
VVVAVVAVVVVGSLVVVPQSWIMRSRQVASQSAMRWRAAVVSSVEVVLVLDEEEEEKMAEGEGEEVVVWSL